MVGIVQAAEYLIVIQKVVASSATTHPIQGPGAGNRGAVLSRRMQWENYPSGPPLMISKLRYAKPSVLTRERPVRARTGSPYLQPRQGDDNATKIRRLQTTGVVSRVAEGI